ncbi:MAG: hypothetical protein JXL85_00360 [Bacilli bacterium]|nr:hypothetical protein [Bacilli bacterium]
MRKPSIILIVFIFLFLISCQSPTDEYTFAQQIEYNDFVGIILIDEQLSIFTDEELNYSKIDYRFSEVSNLKGSIDNRETIRLVHSSAKLSISTYCVYENNNLYDDCYNSSTEDYVQANNYYIVIGFYDPNDETVLGIRFIELLYGYDESLLISEQEQSIQSIIYRYTSVIDSLEYIITNKE